MIGTNKELFKLAVIAAIAIAASASWDEASAQNYPEIRVGTLRALATSASKRIAALPDVPTVRELGYPALEFEGWNGLFAPAKTPKEIIDRLHRETVAAIRHPDVVKRLADIAADPVGSSPAEQEGILRRQMDQFRPVIREMRLE